MASHNIQERKRLSNGSFGIISFWKINVPFLQFHSFTKLYMKSFVKPPDLSVEKGDKTTFNGTRATPLPIFYE